LDIRSETKLPDAEELLKGFTTLLNSHRPRLLAFVMSLLGKRQDAEDVLQRASLTMWKRFPEFDTGTDFGAWSTTVVLNEVKNFRRTSSRSKVLFDETLVDLLAETHSSNPSHLCEEVVFDSLEQCIQKLDPAHQSLLRAVYSEGFSITELAVRDGKPVQTYYNRLSTIRQMLANCMARSSASKLP